MVLLRANGAVFKENPEVKTEDVLVKRKTGG